MLKDLFAFEWRYHVRQLSFAGACLLFLVFGFALAATGFGPPNLHVNSPYNVMQSVGVLSLMSVFVLAVFSANAIVRDREYRMEEIVFSTAVGKRDFLLSRFGGAFLAAMTAFSLSAAGMIAATLLPHHDPARVGALQPLTYVWALLVMAVPNLLFAAVVLFAISTLTRSLLASSVGAVLLYVLYFAVAAWTNSPLMAGSVPAADQAFSFAALLDPFGLSAFFEQTRYWTPAERNTRLTALSGVFLANRLLWLGVAAAGWTFVYRAFAFRVMRERGAAARNDEGGRGEAPTSTAYAPPGLRQSFGAAFLSTTRLEVRSYVWTLPFLALTLLWMGLAASQMISDVGSGEYGSALIPTTGLLLSAMLDPLQLIGLIVLIYISTEMVWRERTLRVNGILNAMPARSSVFVLAKWAALCAIVLVLVAAGNLVAIAMQLAQGYTHIDFAVMIGFVWFAAAPLATFATAAILVHTLAPHKYVGLLLTLVLAVYMKAGDALFGVDYPLWRFGATPRIAYSGMNGFGPFAEPFHWYMLHRCLFAALFLLLAAAFWRGGRSLRRVRAGIAALLVAIAASGTFIYLHSKPREDTTTWRGAYEKKYGRFASLPQPRIAHIDSSLELEPDEERLRVRGEYVVVNETAAPIARVLVSFRREAREVSVSMPHAAVAERDTRFGHYWLALASPLAPGARTTLQFALTLGGDPFDVETASVDNGSFAMSSRYYPTLGYRRSYELTEPHARRSEGLPAKTVLADEEGDAVEWVTFATTLSTPAEQIAVTSGTLEKTWTEGGRRFARYSSTRPVPNGFAYAAARYNVAKATHRGIPIELYHHPSHAANVARMLRAAQVSLATFEQSFGPYPYPLLKIVEVPAPGNPFGGLARPDTIFIGENRGFLIDARNEGGVDLVSRRTAHEVAHEWWGVHVVPAGAPGGTFLAESLTKYAELLVLERLYGREAVRESLTHELDLYLSGRGNEPDAELPLAMVGNQPYLSYRKGAIVMTALRDLLGEPALNAALRRFASAQGGAGRRPLATQLLAELNAVATPAQRMLIHQWLNQVVLYDLKVESAASRALGAGRYEVTMRISAKKQHGDVALPFDEAIDVALLGADDSVLRVEKHRLRAGMNDVRIIVDREPAAAAVDPYLLRLDRNRFDNRTKL